MRLGAKGWVLVARTVRSWGCRPVRLCHRGNSQEFRGDQRYKSAEAVAAFRRQQEQQWKHRNRTVLTYLAAGVVGMAGLSYAAVPLYRLYCQDLTATTEENGMLLRKDTAALRSCREIFHEHPCKH